MEKFYLEKPTLKRKEESKKLPSKIYYISN